MSDLNPYQSPLQASRVEPPGLVRTVAPGESRRRLSAAILAGLVFGLAFVLITGMIVLLLGGANKHFGPGHVLLNTFLIGLPIGGMTAVPLALWTLSSLLVRIYLQGSYSPPVLRPHPRWSPWLRGGLIAVGVWLAALCLAFLRVEQFAKVLAVPVGLYGWLHAWGDNESLWPRIMSHPLAIGLNVIPHLLAGALAGAIFDLQLGSQRAQAPE